LHFALLREIARRNRRDELSMGMSSDFSVAVRFGATAPPSSALAGAVEY
jgi:uncharacterized pyridoxal phosphate-containing UPF0001 family protein